MPDAREPKYRQIFEHVYQGILRGQYRPGARIPTEMELATHFAASRMTVSRALRDLTSQGLLLRRHGAGTFVRVHELRPTGTIGLLLPEFPWFHNGLFDTMSMEITLLSQAAGYRLVFQQPAQSGVDAVLHDPQSVCEPYLKQGVVAVIFAPAEVPADQMSSNARIVQIFEQARIPVILLDRDICDFPARSNLDLVGVDNVGASYRLTQHLLNLGHRRLHYVGTPAVAATVSARIMGYKMALLDHGVVPEAGWVHRGDPSSQDFIRDMMEKSSPDALLCSNDHVAAMLMRHLAMLGIRVPSDVAVVGFDDTPIAALLAPPVTTVRQPGTELGAAAVRVMLERLAHPDIPPCELRLPCELVIRESCGAHGKPVPINSSLRKKASQRS